MLVQAWGAQRCVGRPLGQMLDDPKWESNGRVNPTCLLKSYRGGLRCCKGGVLHLRSHVTMCSPRICGIFVMKVVRLHAWFHVGLI